MNSLGKEASGQTIPPANGMPSTVPSTDVSMNPPAQVILFTSRGEGGRIISIIGTNRVHLVLWLTLEVILCW